MDITSTYHKMKFLLPILIIVLTGCLDLTDGGQSTLIKASSNASGSKKAILFLRESGATVADSYQVSVTDQNHTLEKSEVGNAFTVDTNHGQTIFNSGSIDFLWKSNDTLEIKYDNQLRTFIQNNTVNGVVILYHPK